MPPMLQWRHTFVRGSGQIWLHNININFTKVLLSTGARIVVGIFTTVVNKKMHPTSPYNWLCVHNNFEIDMMSKNVTDFINVHVNRNRVQHV